MAASFLAGLEAAAPLAHKSTSRRQIKYVTNAYYLKKLAEEETHDWSSDSAASSSSDG